MFRLWKVLAVVAASFIVVACSAGNTPEATAKAFIEKSYAGDAEAVLALMHLPADAKPGESELIQGKIKATVAEQKAEAQEKGGLKAVTVQSSEIDKNDPNHARVAVHIQFANGSDTETGRLIKIDGKWKVRV